MSLWSAPPSAALLMSPARQLEIGVSTLRNRLVNISGNRVQGNRTRQAQAREPAGHYYDRLAHLHQTFLKQSLLAYPQQLVSTSRSHYQHGLNAPNQRQF